MARLMHFLRSSIRGRLALLVGVIAVPAMLLVALLVTQAYRNERAAVGRHLLGTARAVSSLVDGHLQTCETLLHGLATSVAVMQGDLPALDARSRSLLQSSRETLDGCWVTLISPDGQMLLNTLRPVGEPLPRVDVPAEALAAAERGETYISNVATGPVAQSSIVYVSVPIRQDGRLRSILSVVMRPATLSAALHVGQVAPGSLVSVVDREGTIAARSRSPEQFVGKKMSAQFAARIAGLPELVAETVTLDGIEVLTAFTRSPRAAWGVVIAAPRAELYASAQRLLWYGLAAAAGILGLTVCMTLWIGRAVVRSVDRLVDDTEAIGRGIIPAQRTSPLAETEFVSAAIHKTARRLHEREQDNAMLTSALQAELAKQRRAEEASRLLAAIVASSDDAIISKDLDGTITSWNQGAERLFGYTAAEIIGRPITLLLPPDRQAEEPKIIARIKGGERVEHFETVRRAKDGRLLSVALTVSPLRGHDGAIVGASKIARDITQRKRSETQQRALYDLVATINRAGDLTDIYNVALEAICQCQEASRAAILLCDAAGVMRFRASRGLSEGYCRAVEGHSPWPAGTTEPASIWIDDVAHGTLDLALRQTVMEEGIRALAFIPLTYEKRLLGKFMIYYDRPHTFTREELRPAETIASQVTFAIERRNSAAALESLVDERTASLRQAVAQMEEFSYSVSHDLRAPVRAMCGYAEAILMDHAGQLDDTGRDLLARIVRNGARMDRLIRDLLTYSRISRREISLEPVSLDKLVHEVVQQYPDMRPEKADIEVQGPLPEVLAHEPSLTQVVSNLLSNAVKFVPPHARPRVRVGFERKPAQVRLWFEDNGIGIKPEYQSRLFGMFERLHPDKNYEGTGIGLAIVRKAVERMNGAVGLESDGVSGSKFWIELPAPSNLS